MADAKCDEEMESLRSSCRRCRSKLTMVILRSSWALSVGAASAVVVSMILAIEEGTSGLVSTKWCSRQYDRLTWSQSAFVDPVVYFGALLLELVDPVLHVSELALELLNLLRVGLHGLVEGSGNEIGHSEPHWGAATSGGNLLGADGHVVVGGGSTLGVRRLLGLLLAGIHVRLVGGREGLAVVGLLTARLGALICVIVE
jgi:hypothetical protein